MTPPTITPLKDLLLSQYTTIGLGGPARYFFSASTVDEIRQCLTFAREKSLRVQVMGGGSNIVFPDAGFDGFVLRVAPRGMTFREGGNAVRVTAGAGEPWDEVVGHCIQRGLQGIECLSGIPGYAGATPIQNVGAYGQEVGDVLESVTAMDRQSLEEVRFAAAECAFGYRMSRFKGRDLDRYIITDVTFLLKPNGRPEIRYQELLSYLEQRTKLDALAGGREVLEAVRAGVLALRRRKSMVIDAGDPDSRSVGSFFMNPILSREEFRRMQERWRAQGGRESIPSFPDGQEVKVPAAWLVEHAGFHKGYRSGGAGVSSHHALALVNYGGSSGDILRLASAIRAEVRSRFGVELRFEPVIVGGEKGV